MERLNNYDTKVHGERLDKLRDFAFAAGLGYRVSIDAESVLVEVFHKTNGTYFSGSGVSIPAALDNLILSMQKVGYV